MPTPTANSSRIYLWLKVLLPPAVVLAAVAITAGLIALKPDQEKQEPQPVFPRIEFFTVQSAAERVRIPAEGTVRPLRRTQLTARVSGDIIWLSDDFYEGGQFLQNQVLLRLDPLPYQTAVAEAEARLANAETVFLQEQENARQARLDWQRMDKVGEPSPLVLRQPQLDHARAERDAAQAALTMAERNLHYTEVRAPYQGRVVTKRVEVGQSVAGPATVLAEIHDTSALEVPVPLALPDLALLQPPGQPENTAPPTATLRASFAGKTHQWQGFLHRTAANVNERSRMIDVFVRVEPPFASDQGWPLTPGMFAEVDLLGPPIEGAFRIPRRALQPGDQVYRMDDQNRLHSVHVQPLRTGDQSVLVSGDLTSGDRLCLTPLLFFVEGMQVEPAS